jgi:hypothetical protein
MDTVFTTTGEFRRGKGNRKTRLGPRVQIDQGINRGDKQAQTPDDIAIKRLTKLLDKPGLTQADKMAYISLMRRAEQLRVMNMPVLAEVLLYIHNVGGVITEQNFNYDAILPYIERLMPKREIAEGGTKARDVQEEDLEIMRLRMAASFLRYIRYVMNLQANTLDAAEIAQAEQPIIAPTNMGTEQ